MGYPKPTDSGLIALWQFENNILDSGPSGYHLSLSGLIQSSGFKTDILIPHGFYCLSGFSPTNRALFQNTTLTGIFNKTNTPDFTIEFEIFPTGVGDGNSGEILAEVSGNLIANANYWDIALFNSSNPSIQTSYTVGGVGIAGSITSIPRQQWSHYAVVYTSATTGIMPYLNGVAGGYQKIIRPNFTKDIMICNVRNNVGNFIAGSNFLLKNLAIYNYAKTTFENPNFITISGLIDNSYRVSLFDSGFNQVSNNLLDSYNGNNQIYSLSVSGLPNNRDVNGPYKLLVYKNNWVCARRTLTGIYDSSNGYNLI